jgi:hypothetical protein
MVFSGNNDKEIRNPWRKRWQRRCHKYALSNWLEIVMQVVILLNVVLMIVESVLERKKIIITPSMIEELEDSSAWDDYNIKCEQGLCGREIMEYISYTFLVTGSTTTYFTSRKNEHLESKAGN